MDFVFQIVVLILSVVIHEVAHGYAARALGDHTAEWEGRLTLNPFKHIDPFGSVILPLLLVLSHSHVILGWAKPVPYNPYNLRPGRFSEALVAGAGPLANILVAVFFGFFMRSEPTNLAFFYIVLINITLAVFNLIPIPPLDGSKILFSFLPHWAQTIRKVLEQYGFLMLIVLVFFFSSLLWQVILPVVAWLFTLITGVAI